MNAVLKTPRKMYGKVISDTRNKTVGVLVVRTVQHSMYGKVVKRSKTYHAHDENNTYKVGDEVEIIESKPYSKTKTWTVSRVISSNQL